MDNTREQQIEAIEVAKEYSVRLSKGIENIAQELTSNRLPDTDEYLNEIVKGINWVIEIVNRTMDVINEGQVQVDKGTVNDSAKKLGEALSAKNDEMIANALGEIKVFIDNVKNIEIN